MARLQCQISWHGVPHQGALATMQIRLRATLADRAAAASTVTEVRDQLTCCARSRNTMSPTGCLPSRSFIEYGVDGFGGFPDFYRNDVPKIFAECRTRRCSQDPLLCLARQPAGIGASSTRTWRRSRR